MAGDEKFARKSQKYADNWRISGITAASFGAVGGIFLLQFFSEVPKVRRDIMQVRLWIEFYGIFSGMRRERGLMQRGSYATEITGYWGLFL